MTEDRDAHLLSGAYALHALTDDEAAAVEAAMLASEELRNEVVGLTDTAVALGLAVPAAAPPPELRSRLLAAIEDLPQQPADDRPAPTGTAAAAAASSTGTRPARAQHVVPRRRRRRRASAVAVALVAAAAVLFSGGLLLQRAVLEPQTRYAHLPSAADYRQASGPVAGGGTATVSWSRSQDRAAVVITGAKVPAGRVLQLWSLRGGTAHSEGLYRPQGDERFDLLDGSAVTGRALAVSIEPAGGSRTPTTIVATIPLTA